MLCVDFLTHWQFVSPVLYFWRNADGQSTRLYEVWLATARLEDLLLMRAARSGFQDCDKLHQKSCRCKTHLQDDAVRYRIGRERLEQAWWVRGWKMRRMCSPAERIWESGRQLSMASNSMPTRMRLVHAELKVEMRTAATLLHLYSFACLIGVYRDVWTNRILWVGQAHGSDDISSTLTSRHFLIRSKSRKYHARISSLA